MPAPTGRKLADSLPTGLRALCTGLHKILRKRSQIFPTGIIPAWAVPRMRGRVTGSQPPRRGGTLARQPEPPLELPH
jgi:hypothetical protein